MYLIVIPLFIILALFLITGLTGAPYVPSSKKTLETAFTKLYSLKSSDTLIDLGSGTGAVLKSAAKHHSTVIGLELNPILVLISKIRFHHNPKIITKCHNFYTYPFPNSTTVVYAFPDSAHLPHIYHKIKKETTRLGHPIYFISNAYQLKNQKPLKQASSFFLYKITP